jgi:hypothetical protein
MTPSGIEPATFRFVAQYDINWYHLIFINNALVIELWQQSHFEEISQEDQIIIIIIFLRCVQSNANKGLTFLHFTWKI